LELALKWYAYTSNNQVLALLVSNIIHIIVKIYWSICLLLVQFIFRRDLKCCPTFSRLKTLKLTEHYVHALSCILKYSPVLESLKLYLLVFDKVNSFVSKWITVALYNFMLIVCWSWCNLYDTARIKS
jgi:hypothetical protein